MNTYLPSTPKVNPTTPPYFEHLTPTPGRKSRSPNKNQGLIHTKNYNVLPREASMRVGLPHPHLFKSYASHPYNPSFNNSSCIHFETSNKALKDLIVERQPRTMFPESDLLALVKGVVSALVFLQERTYCHGFLDCCSIYFDEDLGIFKIYDNELLNGENMYGVHLLKRRKKNFYIAPELFYAVLDPMFEVRI